MPTVVRPSVSALRDWLRTVPGVVAVAAQRVYVGPMPQAAPLPAVVVTRIGGGIADLPLDGVPDDYDDRLHDITWRWRDILGRISALEHGTQGGAA